VYGVELRDKTREKNPNSLSVAALMGGVLTRHGWTMRATN
jgi:hypothetical protein